ncbi:MAG: nitrite reductase small subunit NirD [Pseudomonadota bacterium]|nr:nitrite reductase small subunit NirD [Pseudomonadota bacterium]
MSDWIVIGQIDDIPKLGSRVIATAEGDVAVFRTSDDQVFALLDQCPHKGGPLSQGMVYGHAVACPLHNWSIDLASGEAVAPDEGCTNSYPVKVENGTISIAIPLAKVAAV